MKLLELKLTPSHLFNDNVCYEVTNLKGDFIETDNVRFGRTTKVENDKIIVNLRLSNQGVSNVENIEKVKKWLDFFAIKNDCECIIENNYIIVIDDSDVNKIN